MKDKIIYLAIVYVALIGFPDSLLAYDRTLDAEINRQMVMCRSQSIQLDEKTQACELASKLMELEQNEIGLEETQQMMPFVNGVLRGLNRQ